MGNTPTNAPYEDRFVERLLSWWEESARERFQLLFRPHPRDREWRERFGEPPQGGPGVFVQEPSYTDLEELAVLLQHGDVVVCNAGTILLDALVNERPVRVRSLRRRRSSRRVVGGEERRRRALPGARGLGCLLHGGELRRGGRGHRTGTRNAPASSPMQRRRAVREVVGEVDGRAAERVVDAIVASLPP